VVSTLALGLLVVVFAVVVLRQLSGRGPDLWVTFAVGGLATVALGVVPPSGAVRALETALPVIAFLFALFVFVGELDRAGVIDHIARWMLGKAREPRDLPVVVFLGFGLVAAVLVNDALVLIGVPLLLGVARRIRVDPKPLLLSLAFAVTVGSVMTPLGNPQNLLVSLSSGLRAPIATFLRYLLIPTLANLALGAVYLRWSYGKRLNVDPPRYAQLRAEAPPLIPRGGWARRLRAHPSVVVFPVTLLVMLGSEILSAITGVPGPSIDEIALVGAALVLVISAHRRQLFARVDWTILVLFAGLFLVVGGAEAGGVTGAIEHLLAIPRAGSSTSPLPVIALSSLGGPQVFSNVPWVALEIPVLQGLGYGAGTPVPWLALAGVSTLAGNLTLLGAASNLIVVEQAAKQKVRIGLVEFARDGIPIAAITIVVLLACLWVGL
jgi:Na+/H+ antiporter NhaD/arsenite permease-like protein